MERPTAEDLAAMREDDKRYDYPLTIFELLAEIDALEAELQAEREKLKQVERIARKGGFAPLMGYFDRQIAPDEGKT